MAETVTKKPDAKAPQNGVEKKEETAIIVGGKTISIEEAAAMLDEMEVGEKDSNYLEMEVGEERKVLFLGWEKIPGLGEKIGTMVPAAKFVTNGKKVQINADVVIVSYFEKQAVGITRRIVCTKMVTSKTGNEYKQFDFFELNPKGTKKK